eukprot:scaffold618_cov372-Prasinococcus_capsulatus_cf.AAC.12
MQLFAAVPRRVVTIGSDIYQRELDEFQERFAPVEGVAREAPMTPEELGALLWLLPRLARHAVSSLC